jgi:carbamoyltransferase
MAKPTKTKGKATRTPAKPAHEYVLGISCYYHDSSAALLKDGAIVAAAQEERFTRKKHDSSFPVNAIAYCLASQGITIKDVGHVGFYEKPYLKFERVLHQHLATFPRSFKTFISSMPSWMTQKLRVVSRIRKLGYKGDIAFIEHHLAHAAASFLVSPFDKAAVLTVDGVGEWSTTTYGYCEGGEIQLHKDIRFPHSLGLLYSTITAYLGFSVNNSEYKVMGLAPYGRMDKKNPYYKQMRKLIDVKPDGSYRLDMRYFVFHHADRMPSKELCDLLGGPVRGAKDPVEQRHKDIAAALQVVFEEVMTLMLRHLYRETKCANLVISGGCGLNSVYNGKILSQSPFQRIWIHPDAGDGGTSIGAASYVWNTILGKPRTYIFTNAYLGPSFTTEEIEAFLKKERIKYTKLPSEKAITERAADLIHKDNVVGWFQLGMEWGPRALGARSILSNATNPKMQEILNLKVKHREKFRPFAPAVCEDDANTYFQCDTPIPEPTDYMLMVYPIKEEWRAKIPAVTHVDGSGRLQTVRRHQNPRYYDLIKAFGARSGIPIIINTSYNIRGEPIVCTPFDAYKCMMGTGIDYLVIDRFLIKRSENKRDMWDSEVNAND